MLWSTALWLNIPLNIQIASTHYRIFDLNTLAEAQAILSSRSVSHRLAIALAVIETDYQIRLKQKEISQHLQDRTTKDQREFFLREQLKMVRKELGMEKDEKEELIDKYRSRLTGQVPKEAMKVIDDELAKLQMLEPSSSEYSITRNYLDWLTILPWGMYPVFGSCLMNPL